MMVRLYFISGRVCTINASDETFKYIRDYVGQKGRTISNSKDGTNVESIINLEYVEYVEVA